MKAAAVTRPIADADALFGYLTPPMLPRRRPNYAGPSRRPPAWKNTSTPNWSHPPVVVTKHARHLQRRDRRPRFSASSSVSRRIFTPTSAKHFARVSGGCWANRRTLFQGYGGPPARSIRPTARAITLADCTLGRRRSWAASAPRTARPWAWAFGMRVLGVDPLAEGRADRRHTSGGPTGSTIFSGRAIMLLIAAPPHAGDLQAHQSSAAATE